MANQVKVPKEIQEIFFEAAAFARLSINYSRWLIPSPKAFYYALKAEKVDALAWRTLKQIHKQTASGVWHYDLNTGVAHEITAFELVEPKPKKPRAPRKPKVEVQVPVTPA